MWQVAGEHAQMNETAGGQRPNRCTQSRPSSPTTSYVLYKLDQTNSTAHKDVSSLLNSRVFDTGASEAPMAPTKLHRG